MTTPNHQDQDETPDETAAIRSAASASQAHLDEEKITTNQWSAIHDGEVEQSSEEIVAFDVVFDDEAGVEVIEDDALDDDGADASTVVMADAAERTRTDDDVATADTDIESSETESSDTDIPKRENIQLDEAMATGGDDDIVLKAYPNFSFDHVTLIDRKTKRHLLDDVSWPFYEGSLTAVSIRTADDKQRTATLETLSGFRQPTHGEVTLKSVSLNNYEPTELRGHRITVIPRRFDLRDDLDAVSNLVLAMDASERTFLKPKPRLARELLDAVGFEEQVESLPASQFKPVDRRRVGIARAMALESAAVVIEEPTQDLDETERTAILDLLRDLAKSRDPRRCVIMVTSSDDEIDAADRVIEV